MGELGVGDTGQTMPAAHTATEARPGPFWALRPLNTCSDSPTVLPPCPSSQQNRNTFPTTCLIVGSHSSFLYTFQGNIQTFRSNRSMLQILLGPTFCHVQTACSLQEGVYGFSNQLMLGRLFSPISHSSAQQELFSR